MAVVLATGREPFKLTMMGWFLLYGIMAVFRYDQIASAAVRSFPVPWGKAFLLLIGVCAAAVVYAAARDTISAALRWEMPALIVLTMSFLVYACWSYALSGSKGLVLSGTLLFLSPACWIRLAQILRFRARTRGVTA